MLFVKEKRLIDGKEKIFYSHKKRDITFKIAGGTGLTPGMILQFILPDYSFGAVIYEYLNDNPYYSKSEVSELGIGSLLRSKNIPLHEFATKEAHEKAFSIVAEAVFFLNIAVKKYGKDSNKTYARSIRYILKPHDIDRTYYPEDFGMEFHIPELALHHKKSS